MQPNERKRSRTSASDNSGQPQKPVYPVYPVHHKFTPTQHALRAATLCFVLFLGIVLGITEWILDGVSEDADFARAILIVAAIVLVSMVLARVY